MLKEEFLSLKDNLINTVIEFERLQRKSNFLRQTYLLELSDQIKSEFTYRSENEIMLKSIKLKKDGSSIAEIEKMIAKGKADLNSKNKNFEKQLASAVELSERCKGYSISDMEKMDADFADFCSDFHPTIMAKASENLRNIYSILANLYRNGMIKEFYSFLEESKEQLIIYLPYESSFEGLSYFYNESIANLKRLIEKMKNSFPLNIEKSFESYDSMTTLIGNKREEVYTLREMNKAIRLDYFETFNKEF